MCRSDQAVDVFKKNGIVDLLLASGALVGALPATKQIPLWPLQSHASREPDAFEELSAARDVVLDSNTKRSTVAECQRQCPQVG